MNDKELELAARTGQINLNDPDAFQKLADQIKEDLPNLPAGDRTPTEMEVMQMSAYATAFRKGHPNCTERMVRRAVQKKFKVKIIK